MDESVEVIFHASNLADWATLASVFITAIAVLSAWIGVTKNINNSRDVAKKSQTLNMIIGGEISELHENAMRVLKSYPVNGGVSIATLAVDKNNLSEDDKKSADSIYEILNWYEYLSVGIRHNILSEEILRNSSFSTMNYIWKDSKPFIQGVRSRIESDTFCETFEWLIDRWRLVGYSGKLPQMKNE